MKLFFKKKKKKKGILYLALINNNSNNAGARRQHGPLPRMSNPRLHAVSYKTCTPISIWPTCFFNVTPNVKFSLYLVMVKNPSERFSWIQIRIWKCAHLLRWRWPIFDNIFIQSVHNFLINPADKQTHRQTEHITSLTEIIILLFTQHISKQLSESASHRRQNKKTSKQSISSDVT